MPQSEESIGPLTNGWRRLREQLLERKPRTEGELAAARLMFYAGARHAIHAAAHNTMSLPLMAVEIRQFEREMKKLMEERQSECQPASIS